MGRSLRLPPRIPPNRGGGAAGFTVAPSVAAEPAQSSALDEAEALLAATEDVCDRLRAELVDAQAVEEEAKQRVARIQATLLKLGHSVANLSAGYAANLEAADDPDLDLSSASHSGALEAAILHYAERGGATAADLHGWISKRGKSITAKYVHTYLHRMITDGRAVVDPERQGRRIYLPGPKLLGNAEAVMPTK